MSDKVEMDELECLKERLCYRSPHFVGSAEEYLVRGIILVVSHGYK